MPSLRMEIDMRVLKYLVEHMVGEISPVSIVEMADALDLIPKEVRLSMESLAKSGKIYFKPLLAQQQEPKVADIGVEALRFIKFKCSKCKKLVETAQWTVDAQGKSTVTKAVCPKCHKYTIIMETRGR